MLKRIALLASLALSIFVTREADAQALTPACSSPPPTYGVVWTSGQWIACLSSFQAYLGYVPLNIAGGSMSGELFVATSVTSNAPLNFPPGSAPTSPANGDLWFTTAGLYYRAGGVTVGPLVGTTGTTLVSPTFTGTVTMPDLSTRTSAGSQGMLHSWINRTTDAGGAQLLQVQGNGYMSGGLSLGVTTAAGTGQLQMTGGLSVGSLSPQTGGIFVNTDIQTGGANSLAAYVTGGSQTITAFGTNASTKGTITLKVATSDNSASIAALTVSNAGLITLNNSLTLGASSTITTTSGTLTVGSAGGTTNLADATVHFNNGTYTSCGVLGTSSGNVVCSSPASFITYNDNVTTNTAAVSGNLYCVNTNAGAVTLTLPASPANGAYVAFEDCGGKFAVNNLTIANNGSNLMYNAGNMLVDVAYSGGVLRYSSGQSSWILSPL